MLIFSGIKNSSRNISFLNINRKCLTNSWSQRTTRPIVKIKLFGSRREGTLGGGHKYRPIKSYPLPRVTSRRVRATKMRPLLSSFHPLVFFPRVSPRKMSPRAVYSESDSGSTRMTSLPFPEGLERFASFSPPRGDPLSSSSSLIRTSLFRGEDRPEK